MSWRGKKFGALSATEIDEFLAGPWIARLACLKPDGAPYVVPVWYHWDGDAFWIVPRARSEWAHYMAADPRVSLVVDEPCWTFKIVPDKLTTWQGFGWHKRYFHAELHDDGNAS